MDRGGTGGEPRSSTHLPPHLPTAAFPQDKASWIPYLSIFCILAIIASFCSGPGKAQPPSAPAGPGLTGPPWWGFPLYKWKSGAQGGGGGRESSPGFEFSDGLDFHPTDGRSRAARRCINDKVQPHHSSLRWEHEPHTLVWDELKAHRLQLCPPTDRLQGSVEGRAAMMMMVMTAKMYQSLCATCRSRQL